MDLKRMEGPSAFHGPGWQPRPNKLSEDIQDGIYWSPCVVNSEWAPLSSVVLYAPSAAIEKINDPDEVQHLAAIQHAPLMRNFKSLETAYKKYGVDVVYISTAIQSKARQQSDVNLMYARDLFFNTPEGAVVARMASRVRAGEEQFISAALTQQGVPIRMTIGGTGCFEGADALWVNPKTVICGIGRRTNKAGAQQLASLLATLGVTMHEFKLPDTIQHLLGIVQIVDRDLVFLRTQKVSPELKLFFQNQGFRVVDVLESDDITLRQAFNIVTLAPRTILMPAGCEKQKKFFLEHGIENVEEADISELVKGAGGLGCATGILAREFVP